MLRVTTAAAITLVALTTVASAATPKPKPAWAWTPYEATQVLIWSIPQWNTGATDCRGSRPGGGCDYIEQASCAPIGAPAWVGHYGAFKCSVVYRHWSGAGLSDNPPQTATLNVANSRVGLGSPCVSVDALPNTCQGRPVPDRPNAVRFLYARLNAKSIAYYRCTDKPNANGVYQCVYTFRGKQTGIAAIVLKPPSVALRPSPLSYKEAVCKVFGATSSACKYAPTFP